jgi:hypothetical protein
VWWDGALDDATLHLHFVDAEVSSFLTYMMQLVLNFRIQKQTSWPTRQLPDARCMVHVELRFQMPHALACTI